MKGVKHRAKAIKGISKGLEELSNVGRKFVNKVKENFGKAVEKVSSGLKSLGAKVGNINVPEKVNVVSIKTDTGYSVPEIHVETKPIKELVPGKGTTKIADKVNNTQKIGNGKPLKLEDFTKEILETKPQYSPVPKNWYRKGGTISIEKDGTWVYTNKKGVSIRYPDGFPDFSEYVHPTVKPVEIEVTGNRKEDNKRANIKSGLNKNSDPPVDKINESPEGYTWHHHQDGKTMILVDKKVHREFTHIGGVGILNRK